MTEFDGEEEQIFGQELTLDKRSNHQQVLQKYDEVSQNETGRTMLMEHHIVVDGVRPVRQAPYMLPHAYRESN